MLFIGELTDNKSNVTWVQQESLNKAREYHITFKMKTSVFVAGGVDKDYKPLSSCERFSLNKSKWFPNQHQLPFPLVNATVIVSTDETFAVITGGWKDISNDYHGGPNRALSNETLVFTMERGFKVLSQKVELKSLRGRDVSFRIY